MAVFNFNFGDSRHHSDSSSEGSFYLTAPFLVSPSSHHLCHHHHHHLGQQHPRQLPLASTSSNFCMNSSRISFLQLFLVAFNFSKFLLLIVSFYRSRLSSWVRFHIGIPQQVVIRSLALLFPTLHFLTIRIILSFLILLSPATLFFHALLMGHCSVPSLLTSSSIINLLFLVSIYGSRHTSPRMSPRLVAQLAGLAAQQPS